MVQTNEGSLGASYHPLHGEQLENPYPFYTRARREEPIFFSPDLNTWVVTGYDDILTFKPAGRLFIEGRFASCGRIFPCRVCRTEQRVPTRPECSR